MAASSDRSETSRALSGLERAWLTAHAVEPPFAFCLVFEGAGDLEPGLWTQAVERATAANPGARVALSGALGWTRWRAGGAAPRVRAARARWDGAGPAGAGFLDAPLDARRGPIAEVILVPGAPDRVVVRVLHAAMDGRGVLAFAEDVLACANGREPAGSAAGPQTDIRLSRAAGGAAAPYPARRYAAPTGPARGGEGSTWARVSVDGRFSRLLPRAAAALWRASRRWTDGPLRLEVPVDLRRHAPGLRSTANLSGLFELVMDGEPDLQALEARVREALDRQEHCGAPLRAAGLRWLPLALLAHAARSGARRGLATGRYEVSATLSNLGRLDLEAMGGPVFRPERAFILPPGNQGLPLLMVLVGHARGLEIAAAGPRALCGEGRLTALLGDMASALSAG